MKICLKPPMHRAAFTLLELIIVVVILGIIAAYVQSRFSSSDSYQQDSVLEQIISAGQLTQQLSMNDSARSFSLQIQAHQINLLVDGAPFTASIMNFPLNFGSKVTLSPITNISFDNLGSTSGQTVNVQIGTTEQICFEVSGYIHQC